MYIINPLTKTNVLLLSNEGRNLLKQYIYQYQSGGTNKIFKVGDLILAKYLPESKDIYYPAKIIKKIGSTYFKIRYIDSEKYKDTPILAKTYIKAYTPKLQQSPKSTAKSTVKSIAKSTVKSTAIPGGGGGGGAKTTPYVPVLTPLPKLPDMVIKPGPFRFEFMTHNIGQCQNYKWGVNKKKAQQFYTDSPYRNIVDYFSNVRPPCDLFCLQEVEIDLNNMKVNRYVNGRFQIDGVTYEYIMKPYSQIKNERTVLIDYTDVPYKITNDDMINNKNPEVCQSPTVPAEKRLTKENCIAVVWNIAKFRLANWNESDDLKNPLPKHHIYRSLYVKLKCINGSIIHVVSYHGTNKNKLKIKVQELIRYLSNWKRDYFIMAGDFNKIIGNYITKLPSVITSYSQLKEYKGSPIDHVIYKNIVPIGNIAKIPIDIICTKLACDKRFDIDLYQNDYDHLPIIQEFEIASGGGGSKSTATPGDGGDGGDDDRDGSDVDGEGGADDERDGSDVGGDGGEDERDGSDVGGDGGDGGDDDRDGSDVDGDGGEHP
jgi:hypothetical protein